ncbi:MAG TPA: FAD/NAD(P)-binding oxidoreductase [Gemmatimonadota bacterium]|nr:FAD/NAD(P)-binding oxidoreductase [Gemmatimonadota bacterium]
MSTYDHLIIGAGMAADTAMHAIREADPHGTIGVFGAEPHPPYDRPPLTKALWKGKPESAIWRDVKTAAADLHLGRRIERIDPRSSSVTDDRGTAFGYGKLLIATGGSPRRLPGSDDRESKDRILYYRTLDHYRRLRDLASEPLRFAVVGGGFIGMEIAAALRMQEREVELFVGGDGLGTHLFPEDLSSFLVDYYSQQGVVVRTEGNVDVEERGGVVVIRPESGGEFEADVAVVGIGISPNVELARGAGLAVGDGIEVDSFLRTSAPDVYAAGDVASFHQPVLGKRIRVEHESNADAMGRAAGLAMAGAPSPYEALPFFYSDLFDLGFEAVGELDPRLETFADWKEPFREGVVYYLAKDRVRGVLLWNTWDQVDNARRLIEEAKPVKKSELEGRLPQGEVA